ncbi:hypothetical protein FRC18_000857 [Serendipita sp. 400]|nr:hypothetical protein FRC18_000857 [Serendipita sp. 400]
MLGFSRSRLWLGPNILFHDMISRRMHSVVSGHPLDIVVVSPSPPPKLPTPTIANDIGTRASTWSYRDANPTESNLKWLIRSFTSSLRNAHRKTLTWPSSAANTEKMEIAQYVREILLQPVADLFNQLYSKRVIVTPLYWEKHKDDQICAFTLEVDDFHRIQPINPPPTMVFIPNQLFSDDGIPSSRLVDTLERAYKIKPLQPVIATNLEEIVLFRGPNKANERIYQRISTPRPLSAVRILAAAYMMNTLQYRFIHNVPDDSEFDEDHVLPEGPPLNLQEDLPDNIVFNTHNRHSDFDFATLVRDRKRALQFFRWKDHMRNTREKQVVHPGNDLYAKSNELRRAIPELKPCYGLDLSNLPLETVSHLQSVQRPCPLSISNLRDRFFQSSNFTLQILSVVAKGSDRGICTVYQCRITSIDGAQVESPILCLKLFDDRFQFLEPPEEEEEPVRWFRGLVQAEWHIRQEDTAYRTLKPAQGTIFPWYYGAHQFTLPSGLSLFGILLEYIPGFSVGSNETSSLSSERQIQFVQSCRHGARVLDVADIAQHDWHADQIMVHTSPKDLTHAVFLDLGSTSQTINPTKLHACYNFSGCLMSLTGSLGPVGIKTDLLLEHYGTPDPWHTVISIIDGKVFAAPNPLELILPL